MSSKVSEYGKVWVRCDLCGRESLEDNTLAVSVSNALTYSDDRAVCVTCARKVASSYRALLKQRRAAARLPE